MYRFKSYLDMHTRGWRRCKLNIPIRWAPNDPLEKLLFDLLLLNAEPGSEPIQPFRPETINIETVDQSYLSDHEDRLCEIFGLLAQAHYRTRPSDLKHLLDTRNLKIHIATSDGISLGATVLTMEGGLNKALTQKIWANQSRPVGHLLPELLCAQLGILDAASLKIARVVRTVVKPAFQRQGIGRLMLQNIMQTYRAKVDLVGTTFGVSPSLLRFWIDNGFYPIRLGQRKSIFTGTHSCTLVNSVSEAGHELAVEAMEKFINNFRYQLLTTFSDIDPDLVPPIYQMSRSVISARQHTQSELTNLVGFAFADQPMDHISSSLILLIEHTLRFNPDLLDSTQTRFMVERILQSRPWRKCTASPLPHGRKTGMSACREIIRLILNAVYPEKTRSLLKQYGLNIN